MSTSRIHMTLAAIITLALIITLSCNLPFGAETPTTSTILPDILTDVAGTFQAELQNTDVVPPSPTFTIIPPSPTTNVTPVTATSQLQPIETQSAQESPTATLTLAPTATSTTPPTLGTSIPEMFPTYVLTEFATITTPVTWSSGGFKIKNVNIINCGGIPWANFKITNTSSYALESMYLLIQDLTAKVDLYGPVIANNPFMANDKGCQPGIDTLGSGTRYVGGSLGTGNLKGHLINAIIQLCTLEGLGGICYQNNIEFNMP